MIVDRTVVDHVRMFLPKFNIDDFFCKCSKCGPQNINLEAALLLQKMRDIAGVAVNVRSSFRCPSHNAKEGGAVGSPHMNGNAFDVWSEHHSGFELAVIGYKAGFRNFGIAANWCHVDSREMTKGRSIRFWTYGKLDVIETRKRFEDAIKK